MTENNNIEKARFFAQYLEQLIDTSINGTVLNGYWLQRILEDTADFSVLLTPISDISDEDAVEVARIVQYSDHLKTATNGKKYIAKMLLIDDSYYSYYFSFNKVASVIDLLRSKGYLLPWRDLSVEELIKRGWVKQKVK